MTCYNGHSLENGFLRKTPTSAAVPGKNTRKGAGKDQDDRRKIVHRMLYVVYRIPCVCKLDWMMFTGTKSAPVGQKRRFCVYRTFVRL